MLFPTADGFVTRTTRTWVLRYYRPCPRRRGVRHTPPGKEGICCFLGHFSLYFFQHLVPFISPSTSDRVMRKQRRIPFCFHSVYHFFPFIISFHVSFNSIYHFIPFFLHVKTHRVHADLAVITTVTLHTSWMSTALTRLFRSSGFSHIHVT